MICAGIIMKIDSYIISYSLFKCIQISIVILAHKHISSCASASVYGRNLEYNICDRILENHPYGRK